MLTRRLIGDEGFVDDSLVRNESGAYFPDDDEEDMDEDIAADSYISGGSKVDAEQIGGNKVDETEYGDASDDVNVDAEDHKDGGTRCSQTYKDASDMYHIMSKTSFGHAASLDCPWNPLITVQVPFVPPL